MASETSEESNDFVPTIDEVEIHAPIVGFEVVEARKRFTVYQISVQLGNERNWHVFRRYSDFVRLDEGLRKLFSDFHGVLPPKKYFGDNFDQNFIEQRRAGLQEYINNVLIRQDVSTAQPVAEFFCFDDPPGPYDSIEESRAFIEALEGTVNDMRNRQNHLAAEIKLVKSLLRQSQAQKQALLIALRSERVLNGKPSHDDDDVQLMSEYTRLPEVAGLNFKFFAANNNKIDAELPQRNGLRKSNRFPNSTAASQLDLRIETSAGLSTKGPPPLAGRRARSTSDLSHLRSHRQRTLTHLPSNVQSRGNLDRFFTQSTEVLQSIRNSVRQRLGSVEDETSFTTND